MKTYNYIYKITNLINGKIYIGKHSTDNLDDNYMGSGKLICMAKKKYGIENFSKEYLAFCDNEDTLNWMERFYIRKFNARNPNIGYNLTDGGDGTLGWIASEETRKKLSDVNKGKTLSVEHKHKISASHKGKNIDDKQKNKISETLKELYKYKENHPRYGKHFSEESKQKIRDARIGYAAPNKGKKATLEAKQKMRDAHLGLHHSDESKEKISQSMKGVAKWNVGRHRVYDNDEHTKWHME